MVWASQCEVMRVGLYIQFFFFPGYLTCLFILMIMMGGWSREYEGMESECIKVEHHLI